MAAALKLLGKNIPFPADADDAPPPRTSDSVYVGDPLKPKENPVAKLDLIDHKDVASPLGTLEESQAEDPTRTEVEKNETSALEEKTLKKPDKIIPCPRCNSTDTKFCYYNNYNVNQPRHYCKNCQRYWTAGGNIRNVPFGAGRRKGKSVQYQSPADIVNTFHQQSFRPNLGHDTVLNFGSDSLLRESMVLALNLGKNEILTDCSLNELGTNAILTDYIRERNIQISVPGGRNDMTSAMALRSSRKNASRTETDLTECNIAKYLPHVPNGSCPLLQYPSAACPLGIAMPCHPAVANWCCTMLGIWNTLWLARPPSPIQKRQEYNPVSSKLGKHLRNENILSLSKSEYDEKQKQKSPRKYVWCPKALRIGESKTSKNSTVEAQGINSAKGESTYSTGLEDTFHRHPNLSDTTMQANPAALSRSLNFHESS